MENNTEKQIITLIRSSKKILVMPSSPPDGDSLGSSIALYMILKKLDKEVTVICNDPVPEVLQFLPNVKIIGNKLISSNDFIVTIDCKGKNLKNIKHYMENDKVNIILTPEEGNISEEEVSFTKGNVDYDLIITVDCAELQQLRDIYENNVEIFYQMPVINIDHHISNTHFGKINYVDIMASSTTELLVPILEKLAREEGIELIDEDIATLLLTGVITDTGSFQNANTTPRAFAVSAQLIAYGARQQEIIQHIYKTKQLSQLKLWGRVLSKIQTDEKFRMVWSVVTQQDFKDTGSIEDETGDIIDELMTNAPGAEIIILIKEKAGGEISVSVRTTSPVADAAKIAEMFGGGGHIRAAGFRINDMNIRDAEYEIIRKIREFQTERLKITEPESVEKLLEKVEKAQKEYEKEQEKTPVVPSPASEDGVPKKKKIPKKPTAELKFKKSDTKEDKDEKSSQKYKFEE